MIARFHARRDTKHTLCGRNRANVETVGNPDDVTCATCRNLSARAERWQRAETGWRLGDVIVTDVLIATYGRKHVEKILDKRQTPPLPDKAWEARGGDQ